MNFFYFKNLWKKKKRKSYKIIHDEFEYIKKVWKVYRENPDQFLTVTTSYLHFWSSFFNTQSQFFISNELNAYLYT